MFLPSSYPVRTVVVRCTYDMYMIHVLCPVVTTAELVPGRIKNRHGLVVLECWIVDGYHTQEQRMHADPPATRDAKFHQDHHHAVFTTNKFFLYVSI